MLKTTWRVFKWMLVITIALTATIIGVGYKYLSEADELLHREFAAALHKWAPDVKFSIGSCRADWIGRVHVDQFQLRLPGQNVSMIDLPVTIVDLDREAFIHRQELVVQNLRFIRPQIELHRSADGVWSFENLPPLPKSDGGRTVLPTCDLENARLAVHIEQPDTGVVVTTVFDKSDFRLTPNGRRNLLIKGTTLIEGLGALKLEGRLNIDSRTGSITGNVNGMRFDRDLIALAAKYRPDVQHHVAALEDRLTNAMLAEHDPASRMPYSIAGLIRQNDGPTNRVHNLNLSNTPVAITQASETQVLGATSHRIPTHLLGEDGAVIGLEAELDIAFRVSVPTRDAPPHLQLLADVTSGRVSNTALPFPLDDLTGQIEWSARQTTIQNLHAKNGPTEITIDGTVTPTESGTAANLHVTVTDMVCDERMRSRLSPGVRRLYDMHHPVGFFDLEFDLASAPEVAPNSEKWRSSNLKAVAKKMAFAHDVFPYPIHDVTGLVTQKGIDLIFDMDGFAQQRPISLNGVIRNPGPGSASVFEIDVKDFPLDNTFLQACRPEARSMIDPLRIEGLVDVHCRFEKQAGIGNKAKPSFTILAHDCRSSFVQFPYTVEQLSGKVEFDGRDWNITNLKGFHGAARLSGSATCLKQDDGHALNLTVIGENVAIDSSLRDAFQKHQQSAWDAFSPAGTIDRTVINVKKQPGRRALISLPELNISDGRMEMRSFPYEIETVSAELSYEPGWLTIRNIKGRHNDTKLDGNGFVQIESNGNWRARFIRFNVDDLVPDQTLLNAMRPGLRKLFSTLDARQQIDMSGMLELRGAENPRYPITAAWEIAHDFNGGDVQLGLDLADVQGRIVSAGTWNGYEADVEGTLDLATVKLFDSYRLHKVRGPFRLQKGVLSVGSPEVLDPSRLDRVIDPAEQVTGEFIGGMLALNGRVKDLSDPDYRIRVDLSHGQLERFADLYMKSRERLQGVLNGWLTVEGKGPDSKNMKGRGQLQISPAALYEMPIVFQVLSALTAAPSDSAAFEYARVDFQIARKEFFFSSIDLVGSRIQLRGKGKADFDGRLGLTFVSMLPNSMKPRTKIWIPIATEVAGFLSGVTKFVGVVVEVNGSIDAMKTRVIPAKNIDDTWKRLIHSLKPLPLTPPAPPGIAAPKRNRQRR